MSKHISIFLTAALLLMTETVFASQSSNNDDDDPAPPAPAHAPAVLTPAGETLGHNRPREETVDQPSSKKEIVEDLQCYRVVLKEGNRILIPLFREVTDSHDRRSYLLEDVTKPTGEIFPQSGATGKPTQNILCELSQLAREEILSYLAPRDQLNLMKVSQRFKGAAIAVVPLEDLTTPKSLRKALLIAGLGGQTGDLELFIKDQWSTFEQLSIEQLRSEISSRYYNGTLSPNTVHGKTYREIGKGSIGDDGEHLDLSGKTLKLVSLNFDGVKKIRRLSLCNNQLTVPPVVAGLTNLEMLHLYNNQLTVPPVVTGLPKLTWLYLPNNHLSVAPDLSGLTKLVTLCLAHNQLSSPPVVAGLTKLESLQLDTYLCSNTTLLDTLRELNKGKEFWIIPTTLKAVSKDAQGKDVSTKVSLD